MSTSEYEEEEVSYQDYLVDCLLYPAYCVMSDNDLISCLLQQLGYVALHDDMTGSRQSCGLVDHQIDVAVHLLFLLSNQTAVEDLSDQIIL